MNNLLKKNGRKNWNFLSVCFLLYFFSIVCAFLLNNSYIQQAAVAILIVIFLIKNFRSFLSKPKIKGIDLPLKIISLLLIFDALEKLSIGSEVPYETLKLLLLFIFMDLSFRIELEQFNTYPRRNFLFFILILLLLTGFLPTAATDDRTKGLFTVANNYSQVAFLLVCFEFENKITNAIKYFLTYYFMFLSRTSNSLISLSIAVFLKFYKKDRGKSVLILVLIIFSVFAFNGVGMLGNNNFLKVHFDKLKVAANNYQDAIIYQNYDFQEETEANGLESTSAVWRLKHWSAILKGYWELDWDKKLIGNGINSVVDGFSREPHNEYLRFLYEMGLLGLTAFLLFLYGLYRKLKNEKRWVLIFFIFLIFGANVFDNFLFMFFLIPYLSSYMENKNMLTKGMT